MKRRSSIRYPVKLSPSRLEQPSFDTVRPTKSVSSVESLPQQSKCSDFFGFLYAQTGLRPRTSKKRDFNRNVDVSLFSERNAQSRRNRVAVEDKIAFFNLT